MLRRSAVTKISLFTNKEKEKMLEPMRTEVEKAKELQELAAISALVKPNLSLDELTPLATTMYKAGSSSQAATQAQEKEGGDVEVSIDDSLGIIVAHFQNI